MSWPDPLPSTRGQGRALPAAATLGVRGIVYGDIGTSPLYAFREAVKAASASGTRVGDAVLGTVSLIIWSLILIISLRYAVLIMRADNRGEGGIAAPLALMRARHAGQGLGRRVWVLLGVPGATPARASRASKSRLTFVLLLFLMSGCGPAGRACSRSHPGRRR